MVKEISGLRIARSFISPTNAEVARVIDFQLGPRQGIQIHSVLGDMTADPSNTVHNTTVEEIHGVHTLHLESGSLETVPFAAGEDEDTIDTEIFYRQLFSMVSSDDPATEFRASAAIQTTPAGIVNYQRPILVARNITHRGIASGGNLDFLAHVLIFYVFVEFSLSELGLILARRT